MTQALPPHIQHYAETVRRIESLRNPTQSEINKLNVARLKLACWICNSEGIPATLDNLRIVLGEHAREAFSKLNQVSRDLGKDGPIQRIAF